LIVDAVIVLFHELDVLLDAARADVTFVPVLGAAKPEAPRPL
jgi:hypothetical protein